MADTPFHIVVAEGDSHGRLVLEDTVGALNRGQVKITRVYDGTELLRYLNAAAGEAGHAMPDTVLLDINLSGSGGFDTLEALKADGRFRRLPVCVISAMRDMDRLQHAMELGAVSFFTRPDHVSGYIRIIDEMMSAVLNDA